MYMYILTLTPTLIGRPSVDALVQLAKRHKATGCAILLEPDEDWPRYRKQDSYPEPDGEEDPRGLGSP